MIDLSPLSAGCIHLVGIGGIGMSGIAEILTHLGHRVQGSDVAESSNITRLRQMGILVFIDHAAEQVDEASVVVYSTAIHPSNPEIQQARAQGIPVLSRAEILTELVRFYLTIAVSGSHGKTTLTSLIAHILDSLDPTVINGGIINAYGTNVRLGKGKWMVVEADESDGTFTHISAAITVVTNIDPEHLDYYKSFDSLKRSFKIFMERTAFYGFSVVCYDHPVVRELATGVSNRRLITYGLHPKSMMWGHNIRHTPEGFFFDVQLPNKQMMINIFLAMQGEHNVQNALAALVIGLEMGVDESTIRKAFQTFEGVKRRFTKVAEVNGVTYIDDYAHHPKEIEAVLKGAKKLGRVIAVFQPHRYSRFHDLFMDFLQCFEEASHLFVLPIYAAGENPVVGLTPEFFCKQIENIQTTMVYSPQECAAYLKEIIEPGDQVVFLGAGDVTQWAYAIPKLM